MPSPKGLPQLPTLPGASLRPTGPKFVPKGETVVGGPGETAPPGFLTGQNSLTEWYAYWALAKIFKNPKDPREPPFLGGPPDWAYQVAEIGGHTRAIGSAVVDFVVYQGHTILGIRIVTERFHIFSGSRKQAYDELQRATLEGSGVTVVDVFDNDLLNDPSGQKAVIAMKRAIGRIEDINPIVARTAIRASRQKALT